MPNFYQITLESEDLDMLKKLVGELEGPNFSDDIYAVYPFLAHDENGEEVEMTFEEKHFVEEPN